MSQVRDDWLLLNASMLSPGRQLQLLEAFESPDEIMAASDQQLTEVEGITQAHVKKLRTAQQQVDLAELQEKCAEHKLQVVAITDESYPALLKEIDQPPPVLFVQGGFTKADELALALVGTRKCTPYGRTVARELSTNLTQRGFTIVSGLAVGIDGEAHEAALEAGGRTIAVLACGADITYPRQHRQLREQVAQSGAVITECPFGTPPTRERFPVRNRLISGLSLGTVVVEAPSKSGALITARLAGEQGREVFAVPGNIQSHKSTGTHALLKQGARLVERAEDVIEELAPLLVAGFASREETSPAGRETEKAAADLTAAEKRIYDALDSYPAHIDELAQRLKTDAGSLLAELLNLELKGMAVQMPGKYFCRSGA